MKIAFKPNKTICPFVQPTTFVGGSFCCQKCEYHVTVHPDEKHIYCAFEFGIKMKQQGIIRRTQDV